MAFGRVDVLVHAVHRRERDLPPHSPRVRDVVSVEAAHFVDVLGHAHNLPDLQLCGVVSFEG